MQPQPILPVRWRRPTTSSRQHWPKRIPAPGFHSPFPPRHSRSCNSALPASGVTVPILSSPPTLPAKPDRDRAKIGRDVTRCSVHEAVLQVDFNSTRHLARHPSPNIVTPLIQTGIDEVAAKRNEGIRIYARTPPTPELIAGRTGNGSAAAQTPGAMKEPASEGEIAAVELGYRKVDDGIKCDRVGVISGSSRLRQLLCRVAQRQVRKDDVRAQSQILVRVASHTRCPHGASASHPRAGRAAVKVGAGAYVEVPVLVVVRFFAARTAGYFVRRLLAGAGLLCGRSLCGGSRCGRRRCGGLFRCRS